MQLSPPSQAGRQEHHLAWRRRDRSYGEPRPELRRGRAPLITERGAGGGAVNVSQNFAQAADADGFRRRRSAGQAVVAAQRGLVCWPFNPAQGPSLPMLFESAPGPERRPAQSAPQPPGALATFQRQGSIPDGS